MAPKTFTSTILANVKATPTVTHIVCTIPEDFSFEPGQFISIIHSVDGKEHRRPYSIASAPNKDEHISVCIKNITEGIMSPTLCNLQVGDTIQILGPLGRFGLQGVEDTVFISTGAGIAPFRAMIPALLEKTQKSVTLLAGYRTEEEKLYEEEFQDLVEKYENFSYYTIFSQPTTALAPEKTGRVQQLLTQHITNFGSRFYICGLWPMIEETKDLLIAKGTPKDNVTFERYS
jgi:ring-1,2-phenylacetyl-CoA epoxidase subunit PaaE